MHTKKRIFKPNNFLVLSLLFFLVGCSTTRRLERQHSHDVYHKLNLEKAGDDNFALYNEAALWLGVPYRMGGTSHKGVDCSFLVMSIYKNVYGITLERSSANIMKVNCRKISERRLREGDLVFFNTSGKSRKTKKNINHTGVYLKEHKFLHASTRRGVIVSDLKEDYYQKAWVCGGRVR